MKRLVLCAVACVALPVAGKPVATAPPATIKTRTLQVGDANAFLTQSGQFSADGRIFAVRSHVFPTSAKPTWTVRFHAWDTRTGAPVARWSLRRLEKFALSPDGRTVAVITGERQRRGLLPFAVELRDTRWGKVKRTLIRAGSINAGIYSVAWSRDGKLLATGSGDGLARVWDTARGHRMATLRSVGWVGAVEFSPDTMHLAIVGSSSHGGIVQIWNLKAKKQVASTGIKISSRYATLKFSPTNKYLAVGNTGTGQTILYDTKILDVLKKLPPTAAQGVVPPVTQVAFTANGKQMIYPAWKALALEDILSGRIIRRYNATQLTNRDTVLAIQMLHDGRFQMVTASDQWRSNLSGLATPKLWQN